MAPGNDVVSEAGIVLLRDDLSHMGHLEVCWPDGGEVTEPFVVPFRLQAHMFRGVLSAPEGRFIKDVVFTSAPTFDGNPMGTIVITGHFTVDPFDPSRWWKEAASSIHRAGINSWTLVQFAASAQAAGSQGFNAGMLPIFTTFPGNPLVEQFGHETTTNAQVFAQRDPIITAWGNLFTQYSNHLPIRPINAPWDLRGITGWPNLKETVLRAYAGDRAVMDLAKSEMRCDMNLHERNIGRHIDSVFGVLDPAKIGPGRHLCTFIVQENAGPDGIPGIVAPFGVLSSLHTFVVEVGDDVPPPVNPDPIPTTPLPTITGWACTLAGSQLSCSGQTTNATSASVTATVSNTRGSASATASK